MTQMQLTKSDFLAFRHCSKSLWLQKRKPGTVIFPAPSLFDQLLMQDGYRVEAVVKELVSTWPDANSFQFQVTFQSLDGLFARADLVRDCGGGAIDLYEIKGSTSLKSSTGQDHIDDAAFQHLVAERAGYKVREVHVIHVQKDYVREGSINPAGFLNIVNVTNESASRMAAIMRDADAALKLLATEAIDERGCSCKRIGNTDNHCASFSYFNRDVPEKSVYLLPRISKVRLEAFLSEGRMSLAEIDPSELTRLQIPVLLAAKRDEPVVNITGINQFLNELSWPLHFYDYETFASAIPLSDGLRPQQKVPVQYSMHKLHRDGQLEHFEFLTKRPGEQRQLLDRLMADCDPIGSLIAWNMSFEKSCHDTLAGFFPDAAPFLQDLNARTVDLMDVFKEDYVDIRFKGSTSIKKILPVICPHLQYSDDSVHDGGGAMAAWLTMIETDDDETRGRLSRELKAYCELDSLAMVEIFRVLSVLVGA